MWCRTKWLQVSSQFACRDDNYLNSNSSMLLPLTHLLHDAFPFFKYGIFFCQITRIMKNSLLILQFSSTKRNERLGGGCLLFRSPNSIDVVLGGRECIHVYILQFVCVTVTLSTTTTTTTLSPLSHLSPFLSLSLIRVWCDGTVKRGRRARGYDEKRNVRHKPTIAPSVSGVGGYASLFAHSTTPRQLMMLPTKLLSTRKSKQLSAAASSVVNTRWTVGRTKFLCSQVGRVW